MQFSALKDSYFNYQRDANKVPPTLASDFDHAEMSRKPNLCHERRKPVYKTFLKKLGIAELKHGSLFVLLAQFGVIEKCLVKFQLGASIFATKISQCQLCFQNQNYQ